MRKCPKCKSKNLTIREFWKNHVIEWTSETPLDKGILEQGDPYKVELECEDCGHIWTARGMNQVSPEMFASKKTST